MSNVKTLNLNHLGAKTRNIFVLSVDLVFNSIRCFPKFYSPTKHSIYLYYKKKFKKVPPI